MHRAESDASYSIVARSSPALTVAPSFAGTVRTRPVRLDFSSFCIFMASTTTMPWPGTTASPGAARTRITLPGMGLRMDCTASLPALAILRDQRRGGGRRLVGSGNLGRERGSRWCRGGRRWWGRASLEVRLDGTGVLEDGER